MKTFLHQHAPEEVPIHARQIRSPTAPSHFANSFITLLSIPQSIDSLLLLGSQHGLSDVASCEPYVCRLLQLQHDVHAWEVCSCPLECRDSRNIHVCLRCKILLRHRRSFLVLQLGACLLQRLGDFIGDFLGGYRSVCAVDFRETLTFGVAADLGEEEMLGQYSEENGM